MIPLTSPTQKRLHSIHEPYVPQAPPRHGTPYVAVDDPSEEAALQYMGSSSTRRIENVRPPAHSLPPKLPPSALAALKSGKTTPRHRPAGVRESPRLQAYQGWLQSVPSRTSTPASRAAAPTGRSSRTTTSAESPTPYNVRPATAEAGSRMRVLHKHDAIPPRIARPDSAGWNHLVPLLQRYPAGELRLRRYVVQQASVNPLSGVRRGVSPSEAELERRRGDVHANAASQVQRRRADSW